MTGTSTLRPTTLRPTTLHPTTLHPATVSRTPRDVDLAELRAGDERPVREVFDGLSDHSRRLRFHVPTPRLTSAIRHQLTDLVPGERVGTVAGVDGRAVGMGHWFRDARHRGVADFSYAVVDAHQRRGIGTAIMIDLARRAASAGVDLFCLDVHPANTPMLLTLVQLGACADPRDLRSYVVRVSAILDRA